MNQLQQHQVGLIPYKIIAWVCIVLCISCSVLSWQAGQESVIPFFLIMVAIGLLMLSTASHIKLNELAIIVYTPFAKYRIAWSEIEWIEAGGQGTFVFHGKGGKRLVIPPASVWSGDQKHNALKFMGRQVHTLQIKVVPSNTADFKFHKNVKVENV